MDDQSRGDNILIRFHEVALKGGNRGFFENRLATNASKLVGRALGESAPHSRKNGRILLHAPWTQETRQGLERTFGISSYSPMHGVATDLGQLTQAVIAEVKAVLARPNPPKTFRIRSRRSDKLFGMTSMEIDRHLGDAVFDAMPDLPMNVELKHPEVEIGVEVRKHTSFVYSIKVPGAGGLPVGTSGKVLTLLSGGLDSPVAALQMMKRGSHTAMIHFYGAPFVGEEVLEKVQDLAKIVNRYSPQEQALYIVPFGKLQEKIALATNPKLRTILYRRMMMRIASLHAKAIGAQALVTGESLAQVASQTLENLTTIDAAATTPILRPLITRDKDEIVDLAHKMEAFEVAVRPGADCCTLFADRHPSVKTSLKTIEAEEARFPVVEFVQEALSNIYTP